MNVLVLDTYADVYARHLHSEFPGLVVHAGPAVADLDLDLAAIDVLVAFGIFVDDDLIRRATRLKWIQSLATGVDHFLRCPSLRADTIITSARGIHGTPMRETVAWLMLTMSRDTPWLARRQAEHRWDRSRPWPLLAGKTAVVVGTGVIGSAVGGLLRAFGMRVVGVSRTPRRAEGFDAMMETARLTEAVVEADYVINILPGAPHNARLIGAAVFAAMKPAAFFINVGRGETVDEEALIAALRERRIAGAGLDVFHTEPLPAGSPLWDFSNVFISPHIGAQFSEYEDTVMPILIGNVRLFLAGRQAEMHNLVAR